MSERDEQIAVIQWSRYNYGRYPCLRWLHSSLNGASFEHKKIIIKGREVDKAALTWKRHEAEGAKQGIPDLFLPWAARGFHGFYIEMKRPGNMAGVREGQADFMAYAESAGYLCQVLDSAESAIEALEWYLGETR